jgi:hypothetical protein
MEASSKKFMTVCTGISMVLVSASIFFFSIKSSFAGNETNNSLVKSSIYQAGGANGKYMMNYQVFKYKDGGEGYNVLVWDTQSGRAKIYYYDTGEKKMKVWVQGAIPNNPLD